MKEFIYCTLGAVGAVIASFFGGWGTVMSTLGVLMALDYLTGMIVAGVFHASPKTDEGGLESRAGWKGLCRKGMTLIIIIVASRVDVLLGTTYFRDGTAIAFIINEALSIIENAGLMGVPIPAQLKKAIEVLKAKNDADIENE
ncbi:MAG: phage holin family protein [Bacteroidales bacterium]|nr:phage holin family protein [Bacteroidales bacterium]